MATESTSVLRHRRNGGATAIPWSTLQDPNLSFTARGVLAYCLSLPDGWAFSAKRIAASTPHQGQQAVLTALKQLEKVGYRKVTTERGERGRFRKIVEFSYVPVPEWIQDDNQDEQTFPQVTPKPGKPSLGNPGLGGPGKTNVSAGRTEARETETREPETLRGVNPEGYTHTAREASTESAAAVEPEAGTGVCFENEKQQVEGNGPASGAEPAPPVEPVTPAGVDAGTEAARRGLHPTARKKLKGSQLVRARDAVAAALQRGCTAADILAAVAAEHTDERTTHPATAIDRALKCAELGHQVDATPIAVDDALKRASRGGKSVIDACTMCDPAGVVEIGDGRFAKCRHDGTTPQPPTAAPAPVRRVAEPGRRRSVEDLIAQYTS